MDNPIIEQVIAVSFTLQGLSLWLFYPYSFCPPGVLPIAHLQYSASIWQTPGTNKRNVCCYALLVVVVSNSFPVMLKWEVFLRTPGVCRLWFFVWNDWWQDPGQTQKYIL